MSIGYVQTNKLLGGLSGNSPFVSTVVNNTIVVGGSNSGTNTNFFPNGIIVNGLSSFSDNVTFTGGITVTGTAPVNLQSVTGINLTGPVTMNNNLSVSGNSTLASVSVTGSSSLSNLSVSGTLTLNSLTVSGTTTLNGVTNINNNLTVTGTTQLNSTLNVVGTATLQSSNILKFGVSYILSPATIDVTKTVHYIFSNTAFGFVAGYDTQILILSNSSAASTFDTGSGVSALAFNTTYIYQYISFAGGWSLVGRFSAT